MLNTGDKFQNRNCDKTFAVIHQLLNGSNAVCQNQTSIVNPCDLESGEEFIINSQIFFLYKRHLTTTKEQKEFEGEEGQEQKGVKKSQG